VLLLILQSDEKWGQTPLGITPIEGKMLHLGGGIDSHDENPRGISTIRDYFLDFHSPMFVRFIPSS